MHHIKNDVVVAFAACDGTQPERTVLINGE